MGRVALRGIRAHLVRFVLSLLAVALGVAFVAGTFSLRTMMSSTFDGIVDAAAPGDAYLRFEQDGTATAAEGTSVTGTVPRSLAEEIEALHAVDVAIPEVQGPVVLVGADGTAVQSTQAPSFAFRGTRWTRRSTWPRGAGPSGPARSRWRRPRSSRPASTSATPPRRCSAVR